MAASEEARGMTQDHVADLYDDRPEHHPEPLPADEVLTALLLNGRLAKIRSMCTAGQPLYPIIAELRYLADALEHVDRSTRSH